MPIISPNMKNNIMPKKSQIQILETVQQQPLISIESIKFVYHVHQANLTSTCIQTYAKTVEALNTTKLNANAYLVMLLALILLLNV